MNSTFTFIDTLTPTYETLAEMVIIYTNDHHLHSDIMFFTDNIADVVRDLTIFQDEIKLTTRGKNRLILLNFVDKVANNLTIHGHDMVHCPGKHSLDKGIFTSLYMKDYDEICAASNGITMFKAISNLGDSLTTYDTMYAEISIKLQGASNVK